MIFLSGKAHAQLCSEESQRYDPCVKTLSTGFIYMSIEYIKKKKKKTPVFPNAVPETKEKSANSRH